MNDRYLCKAKRTDNGEWVEGYYCERKTGYYDNIGFQEEYKDCIIVLFSNSGITWVDVDPSTLCQYTGLHDATKWGELTEKEQQQFLFKWNYKENRENQKADWNGKKIWENDIVMRTDLHDSKEPSLGFIEYDKENTSFLIHWIDVINYSPTYPWKDKIKAIGNIFDNSSMIVLTDSRMR